MPRRRLSAFRPHHGLYAAINTPLISVEQLPNWVLTEIFLYLQQADLANVCIASKYFYLPAASMLYRKIVVILESQKLQVVTENFSNYGANYGTLVMWKDFPKLVQVITNSPKLAAFVHTVVSLSAGCNVSPLLRLVSAAEVWSEDAVAIETESWAVTTTLLAPVMLRIVAPNLVHLQLRVTDQDPLLFSELGQNMAKSGIAANLRLLEMFDTMVNYVRNLNLFNSPDKLMAPWIAFFGAIADLGIQMLLRKLGLSGYLGNKGAEVVALLAKATDLWILESLQLLCRELSHGNSQHEENYGTILEQMMHNTPLVTHLAVSPTFDCLVCQEESLARTLEDVIPHQLHQLHIEFESRNAVEARAMKKVILASQLKLQMLYYRDRSVVHRERASLVKYISDQNVLDLELSAYYAVLMDDVMLPSLLGNLKFARPQPDTAEKCLDGCSGDLWRYFEKDPIVAGASANLPDLVEYQTSGIRFDLSRSAFVANGRLFGGNISENGDEISALNG